MVEIPAVERQHRYCANLEACGCEMLARFLILLVLKVSQSVNDLVDRAKELQNKHKENVKWKNQ
jgi:hypothetical protein